MARPLKPVSEEAVFELACRGWTNKEIAAACGCSHDTIERRFAEILKEGHAIRNGKLRAMQYEVAMSGNPTMLIWLGKQLLAQREKLEQVDTINVRDAIERGKHIANGRINGNPAVAGGLPESS